MAGLVPAIHVVQPHSAEHLAVCKLDHVDGGDKASHDGAAWMPGSVPGSGAGRALFPRGWPLLELLGERKALALIV